MNHKFLAVISGLIFICTGLHANTDPNKFTLINKSGYNIKYRLADENAPTGSAQEHLLANGESVLLEKNQQYSIRRSGVGSTVTASWWNIPQDSTELFTGGDMSRLMSSTNWRELPSAKIFIHPGIIRGWTFKGDYDFGGR